MEYETQKTDGSCHCLSLSPCCCGNETKERDRERERERERETVHPQWNVYTATMRRTTRREQQVNGNNNRTEGEHDETQGMINYICSCQLAACFAL